MNEASLTDEKVRNGFYSLKTSKIPVSDNTSSNPINNVFDFVIEPLRYILSNSLAQRMFLEEIKFARITPIYKGGDK